MIVEKEILYYFEFKDGSGYSQPFYSDSLIDFEDLNLYDISIIRHKEVDATSDYTPIGLNLKRSSILESCLLHRIHVDFLLKNLAYCNLEKEFAENLDLKVLRQIITIEHNKIDKNINLSGILESAKKKLFVGKLSGEY